MTELGYLTQIMRLKDSGMVKFMYRGGSFGTVTLAFP